MEDSQEEIIVDENFSDGAAEYSTKSEFNKPGIVAEAVRKCIELRAKPMCPGFYNTVRSSDGTISKQRVDDARQAYISAVIGLKSLLHPEIKRDSEYKKFDDAIIIKLKSLFNNYCYEEKIIKEENGRVKLVGSGKRFMPEIDDVVPTDNFILGKHSLYSEKGYWNTKVNAYWDLAVEIYDEIFAELNLLVDRLNYFKSKPSF